MSHRTATTPQPETVIVPALSLSTKSAKTSASIQAVSLTTASALSLTTIPAELMAMISTEVGRARVKYPHGDLENRIDGFMQEAGEASQALIKYKHDLANQHKRVHARLELIQCAGQIIRLLTEAI